MTTLDGLIGSWAPSLRAAKRRPRTVAQYVDGSLAQFRRGMDEHQSRVAPPEITRQRVEQYLSDIAATRSASTAQTRYNRSRCRPTATCGPSWPAVRARASRTAGTRRSSDSC